MTIAFVSNYFNHHQVAICDELFRLTEGNFVFVETEEMPDNRKKLGYSIIERSYVLKVWSGPQIKSKALAYCENADVLIAGGGSFVIEYEKARLIKGMLTLEYAERTLKKGWINLFSPTNIKMQLYYHLFFYNKPFYKLCASAFTARDMYIQKAFVGKCLKYGYFPYLEEVDDFDSFLEKKFKCERLKIVWCARFINWKHPEMAIKMAEELINEGYDFELNMIGCGDLYEKMGALVKTKKLTNCVRLLGSLSNKCVIDEMRMNHIFLFTSNRNEGWGVVLNEAMGQGCCPIVSNMVGAAPYLIDDKENGLLFESEDMKSLIMNMKFLLDNPDMCKQMAKRAYQKVFSLWSPQIAATRLYEFCNSYMNGELIHYENGPMSCAPLV